ncbi:unnamed protein product [Lactuca saligna]|uniref:Uncharacterized protein n=1 Tax=Lactuca saligna TaxID=75948 RepID=A0AA35ZUA8_LACSI|nr:unnamed protein product [Lactuca saligna]
MDDGTLFGDRGIFEAKGLYYASFFMWFFTGGDGCGFSSFPTFGLKHMKIIRSILSWGIMWPLINEKKAIGILYSHVTRRRALQLHESLFGLYHRFKDQRFNRDTPITGNSPRPPLPIINALNYSSKTKSQYGLPSPATSPAPSSPPPLPSTCSTPSNASTYRKLTIFEIGAWVGNKNGRVLAGLAACGVMMNIFVTASDLMQDFKTGYMTLASPRSMFVSQVYTDSNGDGDFVNGICDSLGNNWARFIRIPMAMAIPFYIRGHLAIDMCVGSLILYIWSRFNKAKEVAFGLQWLRGLICGNGIWSLDTAEFDSCFGSFKCFPIWIRDLDVIEYGNVLHDALHVAANSWCRR